MAHVCRRLSLLVAAAILFGPGASAVAATRMVTIGPNLTHSFVDEVSGTTRSRAPRWRFSCSRPSSVRAHVPPACTGLVFDDVPCTGGPFDPWIEELASLQLTGGCQAVPVPLYCPTNPNTRGQMAVFIVKNFSLP